MAALRVVEEPLDAKYELQSTIGVGAYGKALLAVRKEDKQQVTPRSTGPRTQQQRSAPCGTPL